jgi:uncharacterized protein
MRFGAIVLGAFLALAVGASAHVRLSPTQAAHGASVLLAFHVPDERNASTVALAVQFPPDAHITVARVRPLRGWTAHVAMKGGAVDTITWSGGAIRPLGQQTFSVWAGPLPATGRVLYFKAVQTYSSGEIVRWIQVRNPGEAEPPNPAPMLRLVG